MARAAPPVPRPRAGDVAAAGAIGSGLEDSRGPREGHHGPRDGHHGGRAGRGALDAVGRAGDERGAAEDAGVRAQELRDGEAGELRKRRAGFAVARGEGAGAG